MKRRRSYDPALKESLLARALAPDGPSQQRIADEAGIPASTLSQWVQEARTLPGMARKRKKAGSPNVQRSTREWSPSEKLRVVTQSANLTEEELGEFLRREGLHAAQLEEWRSDILVALGAAPQRKEAPEAKRLQELEREVARKDKALAEVTALLVLRKKLEALFGTSPAEGDSTDEKNGKK
jgi:transposase